MLNDVLKFVKEDICWCKSYCITTRNKLSGGCVLQIFTRSTFKTWNKMYKEHVFLFDFGWSWYCLLGTGGRGVGLLNGQNLLSVTKVICRWSLKTRTQKDVWNLKSFHYTRQTLRTVTTIQVIVNENKHDLSMLIHKTYARLLSSSFFWEVYLMISFSFSEILSSQIHYSSQVPVFSCLS